MRARLFALACLAGSCGGATPAAPRTSAATPAVSPTPASVHPVSGAVFYDEDGDGVPGRGEDVRMARVVVSAGGRSAETDADGSFTIPDVPAGRRQVDVGAASLPAFFRGGRPPVLEVPLGPEARVPVPVVLPIGTNRPHVYLAFGDSITAGDGSRGGRGYRSALQARLREHWGRADVLNDGVPSTRSDEGAARLGASLAAASPAYVLVEYGTNDWNVSACRRVITCFTIESVRSMIRQARAAGVMPVVGTIVPANPDYVSRLAPQRNAWIDETNAVLVPMARAEGAVVADLNAALRAASADLSSLFTDHVHPNDSGYEVIAGELFRAITSPAVGAGPAAQDAAEPPEAAGPLAGRASSE